MILVLVTSVYVILTHRLAKEAAKTARAAAEATALAESKVDVSLELRYIETHAMVANALGAQGVKVIPHGNFALLNEGPSVWVHSVEVSVADLAVDDNPREFTPSKPAPWMVLPSRMKKGESALFRWPWQEGPLGAW